MSSDDRANGRAGMPNDMLRSCGVLRAWASLGHGLAMPRDCARMNWGSARRLIKAAQPKLRAEAQRLRELLQQSRKRLDPLDDPVRLDLGLNRWLEPEREEAYSDWLQWVVRQARTAEQIFKLFDLKPPPPSLRTPAAADVHREYRIPYGHLGKAGRLDLVVDFGGQAIIVIELKKGDADESDTAKHKGYREWLAQCRCPKQHRHSILLALSAADATYDGFVFRSWANACINMRRFAESLLHDRVMTAAMVLAYVAAIEQNLLGFSASQIDEVCRGRSVSFNPRVVEYLERFLES